MDGIDLRCEGKVGHVVLCRPERRNAFDTTMIERLDDVIQELGRRRDLEVAVLQAEGAAFCAGTDLKELAGLDQADTLHWQRRTGEVVERWARLHLTTVTAFNGPAIGSGAVLGLTSDIRLAADRTFFSFPEVAFGLPLTWSGIPVLTALLGPDRTKRLLLLGERLDSREIEKLDLVASVVSGPELPAATQRIVDALLATPLLARQMAKQATAVAAATPGFVSNRYEPFMASLAVAARAEAGFDIDK